LRGKLKRDITVEMNEGQRPSLQKARRKTFRENSCAKQPS
jgi:hypothetical protein